MANQGTGSESAQASHGFLQEGVVRSLVQADAHLLGFDLDAAAAIDDLAILLLGAALVESFEPRRCWRWLSWFCKESDLGKKEEQSNEPEVLPLSVPEVRALLRHLLDVRQWNSQEILH